MDPEGRRARTAATDPDSALIELLGQSRGARERAVHARVAAAAAVSRSERLRDLLDTVGTVHARRRQHATTAPPIELEPVELPVPDLATEKPPRSRRQAREAHFAVASIVIDGELWPVRNASLDIYHQGPDFDDPTAALWEVHCTTLAGGKRPAVRHEYSLTIETANGRRFVGRVFTQHASSELCTFLDVGEPLGGLHAADYLD